MPEARTDCKYSVCKGCGHRKLCWMPARVCAPCLNKVMMFQAHQRWQMNEAIDAELAELGDE